MAKHRPGEGMTPVAELVEVKPREEIEWPTGATEEYADELHEINGEAIVNEEARA